MYFLLCIVILIVVVKILCEVVVNITQRLRLAAIPSPPLDSWYHGHATSIAKSKKENRYLDLITEWVATYGDTFVIWAYNRFNVFTCNAQLLQQVTTDLVSFSKLLRLPNRSLFGETLVGFDSMLSGSGVKWAMKRKFMTKFFAKVNMEQLFYKCKPHMGTTQLARMERIVGDGEKVEMIHEMGIVFTSYLHVLGLEGFFTAEKVAQNVEQILKMLPVQVVKFRATKHIQTLLYSQSDEIVTTISMIKDMRIRIKELIQEKINAMEDDELEPTDLLRFLIQANRAITKSDVIGYSNGKSDNENMIEAVTNDVVLLCLVMDNIVKQIGSLFIFLKDVPDVQQKMFEELRAHPITDYASLGKLEYTEKCLLESLRLGPAVLRGVRKYQPSIKKGSRFGPYAIQVGVTILYSAYVTHRNEQHWENAKQFDPDRWNNGFTPTSYSYMPFLVGPRSCIAKYMSMMMMKLTLSILACNFDFTPKFDENAPPAIDQTMAVMRIQNKIDYLVTPVNLDPQ